MTNENASRSESSSPNFSTATTSQLTTTRVEHPEELTARLAKDKLRIEAEIASDKDEAQFMRYMYVAFSVVAVSLIVWGPDPALRQNALSIFGGLAGGLGGYFAGRKSVSKKD